MSGFYLERCGVRERQIAEAIEAQQRKYILSDCFLVKCSSDEDVACDISNAIIALTRDHPELWFLYGISYTYQSRDEGLSIHFILPDKREIISANKQIEEEMKKIIFSIASKTEKYRSNPLLCQVMRETLLYRYLQEQVYYRNDGLDQRYTIKGALLEHEAVCAGISDAFTLLARRLGIRTIIAFGEVPEGLHQWNLVQFRDGEKAFVDATSAGNAVYWDNLNLSSKMILEKGYKPAVDYPDCKCPAFRIGNVRTMMNRLGIC